MSEQSTPIADSELLHSVSSDLSRIVEMCEDVSHAFDVGKRPLPMRFENGTIFAGGVAISGGMSNADVEKLRGDEWIKNARDNYKRYELLPSAGDLYGLFAGKEVTAIIVGNGSSFHDNIDKLVSFINKNNPLVVACDRVFDKLKSRGISPDITMTIDGQEKVDGFFNIKNISKKDFFVPTVITHKKVIDKLSHGNMFVGGQMVELKQGFDHQLNIVSDTWNRIYGLCGTRFFSLMGGYVVGDFMARLACGIGCDMVISIGNDLCFRDSDYTNDVYAKDYPKYLVTLNGEKYTTTEPFFLGATKMSEIPKEYEAKCVDCSDAMLHGWIKSSIDELAEFCDNTENPFKTLNYKWELKKKYDEVVRCLWRGM